MATISKLVLFQRCGSVAVGGAKCDTMSAEEVEVHKLNTEVKVQVQYWPKEFSTTSTASNLLLKQKY